METQEIQNQIVIKTPSDSVRQKFPVKLLFSLAAGALTGGGLIFVLLWGVELILGH